MSNPVSENSISGGVLFTALSLGVLCYNHLQIAKEKQNLTEVKEYTGSCHCKAVTFSFTAPKHLTIWDCNCSVCFMKKNAHVVISQTAFKLLTGKEALSLYTFNTKVAKHYFCKHCGVQAFYNPRSNPDGVGVTFACINQDQITSTDVRYFDGDNWEQFITESGIQKHSQ